METNIKQAKQECLTESALNKLITRSVKRHNIPNIIEVEHLFYKYDEPGEDEYKYFFREEFEKYYHSLSDVEIANLKSVFLCMEHSIAFKYKELPGNEIELGISNQLDSQEYSFVLPGYWSLDELLSQYINEEIICSFTLEDVIKHLQLNHIG